MRDCRKILVGVDLSQGDWQVADQLPAATKAVVHQAAEFALGAEADLHLRAVIELDPKTQWLLEHYGSGQSSVVDRANQAIDRLVADLKSRKINASGDVAVGKASVELSRLAHDQGFDVVMVGAHRKGIFSGWFVGSTGRQLLRHCRVPVWIHKITNTAPLSQVLVATDFSPVADDALELGAAIAAAEKATLHVLHVASVPSDSLLKWGDVDDDKIDAARSHLISDARDDLNSRITTIDADRLTHPPVSHLLTGEPGDVIADQVKQHKVDLLVIGTLTQHRHAWQLIGNTAERLLAALDCSLLAVKPADFKSPL